MSKSARSFPRPLSDFTAATLSDAFKAQGFASSEIIARWADIAGADIAPYCEPIKINWPRAQKTPTEAPPEPATLVLRVEGPMALEIQHMSAVILDRVNRFFGWQAIGRLTLRQAPLRRPAKRKSSSPPDPAITARLAAEMPEVENDDLKGALAKLGAAIKRK